MKLAVKESLLGTTREPELSRQARATFDRNATQDEATQELYMTEDDFVNAVAPSSENYVRTSLVDFPIYQANQKIGC